MSNLYEDDLIIMHLADNPVAVGHIVVEPKKKTSDLQSLDDKILEHLFFGASYAATALFELANAQGTNIILEEHDVRINVVARMENDGLDFLWEPKQANQDELKGVAKSIKDKLDVQQWKENNPQEKKVEAKPETVIEKKEDSSSNFLFKSLHRIP